MTTNKNHWKILSYHNMLSFRSVGCVLYIPTWSLLWEFSIWDSLENFINGQQFLILFKLDGKIVRLLSFLNSDSQVFDFKTFSFIFKKNLRKSYSIRFKIESSNFLTDSANQRPCPNIGGTLLSS